MKKLMPTKSLAIALLSVSTLSCAVNKDINNTISLAQVTKDVSYLASDELNGRGNFSKDINKAASYIAQRFEESGLSSANNAVNFQQSYQVKRILPKSLTVSINGKQYQRDKLALASTVKTLDWTTNTNNINTHTIAEQDNMREKLGQLNQQGGMHLVVISTKHQALFSRYQNYFNHGLTKLETTNTNDNTTSGGAIVMVLTDDNSIDSFSVAAQTSIEKTTLTNVVGVLPGKSKANEIVLYSAHYDHLGAADDKQIYNGADDDASGTSAIINLANYFAKENNNERTLMFAAFSAEEIGGFGSKYFSKQLDPNAITAMINIEMIGKPSKFGAGTVWMTGMERSSLGEQLNEALAAKNLTIYQDPYPKQQLFYRSDNATLARLGVPAHSFSSTQLDKDQHYHQVTDDIASLDLNSMHQVIQSLAIATTPLVTGEVTPSRIDVNKVKAKGKIY
ncbi:M28 family peptidase [Litorilituus sediminis]|uniref:M28 family peptidase n=1 Tax=Litorilituus sediminis TaxID=718192 RepID=A0A4P6P6H4_9GAMM|nr:M28 family peptidase [Litorilituus sediminis]QBG34975.1 M28 family peptidase [Litorilituus sediminis]